MIGLNLMEAILPLALAKIAETPTGEKRALARFASDLCLAFVNDDRVAFDDLLVAAKFSPRQRDQLIRAMWGNADQSK